MSNPTPTEAAEQAAFCQWLQLKRIAHFSVPNEGRRHVRFKAKLADTGMQSGAPDLVIIDLASCGHPVAVEMKRTVGGKLTAAQETMHRVMCERGWHVIVARGCKQAIEQMTKLGFGS